jgi:hypothetical protein
MQYDDNIEAPPFRPIPPRPVDFAALSAEGKRVAEANPRWGPKQIEAELRRIGAAL